ncbi:hypothetical protein BDC45DRAFT_433361 [Circinella umbellata]|nr:hypothetical protein BDC45DRAFT_433361 [Circinella umbellata]
MVYHLGGPQIFKKEYFNNYCTIIINKIERHSDLVQQRNLSIKGKDLVVNSLLLSKLWHILTVTPASPSIFQQVKSICGKFLKTRYPPTSRDSYCQPRSKGGIGVIDPSLQKPALQSRWISIFHQLYR